MGIIGEVRGATAIHGYTIDKRLTCEVVTKNSPQISQEDGVTE
jgi:hypothetical protein